MSASELEIKISTAVKLEQLRAMEQQLQKQIVQLRALGDTGTAALKKVEKNLALVRGELGKIGTLSKFNAALGDTMKSIPVVGSAMNVLNGSAAAVGVGIGALTYGVTQFRASLNFAAQLQDVSDHLNLSSSALQTLNAHFADAGIKAPQVASLLQKMQESLSRGAAGDPMIVKAFAALNLSIGELRAMSPERAMEAYGAALARAGDDAAAASASMDILGRNSIRAVNAIKELGTQGYDTVAGSMASAGRVIEDEMVTRLDEANRQLEKLDQRWTIFKANIAAGLLDKKGAVGSTIDLVTAGSMPEGVEQSEAMIAIWEARENKDMVDNWTKRAAEQRAERDRHDPAAAHAEQVARRRAAMEAAALAEKQRLMAAQELTAELAKQAPEVAKGLQAAQYTLATDQEKLVLLDAQAEAAAQRHAKQIAAAQLTKDEVAAKQADEGHSLALLLIEKERRAVQQAIVQTIEKERVEKERQLEQAAKLSMQERAAAIMRAETAAKQLDAERQMAAANDGLSPEQKAATLASLTERLRDALEEVVRLRKAEIELASSPIEKARAEADLAAAEGRLPGVALGTPPEPRRIDSMRASYAKSTGPLALTRTEGIEAGALSTLEQIGTTGDMIARGVQTAFQGAFQGISTSLQGLIDGTMSWGDALKNIAGTISQSIISAISDMFAQWIVRKAAASIAEMTWDRAVGANKASSQAPGAMMSSISSWGTAAAVGAASFLAAMALSQSFATGGKVTGPGTDTSDSIMANLSNGEYVIRAAAARQIGYDKLDAINSGRTPAGMSPLASSGGAGGGGGSVVVNHTYHAGVTRADLAALVPEIERRTIAAVHDRNQRNKI